MRRAYKFLVVFLSVGAFGAAAAGVVATLRSPLFTVKVIEVVDAREDLENAQLDRPSLKMDEQAVLSLAAIPTGSVNLFDLNFKQVEQRLLTNPWIKEVKLTKRFPETVSIAVRYREPMALLQGANGTLSYLDADGDAFGRVDLTQDLDLPVFSGFDKQPLARIQDGIQFLRTWQAHEVAHSAQVASIQWDPERGFRAQAVYSFGPGSKSGSLNKGPAQVSRVMIQLGQNIYGSSETTLTHLARVIRYLSDHSIASRQILADAGKKIVVKTAYGS